MLRKDFQSCDQYQARLNAFRPFPPETLASLRDYYRVGLTWSSNALEGNTLTESETKVVIEDGLAVGGHPRPSCARNTSRLSPARGVRRTLSSVLSATASSRRNAIF